MKDSNKNYIDSLISKVISETLEEKSEKLAKKLNMSDSEVDDLMYSNLEYNDGDESYYDTEYDEYNEDSDVCEQCGGYKGETMMEGKMCECGNYDKMYEEMEEGIHDVSDDFPKYQEFDYVAEEDEFGDEGNINDDEKLSEYCSKSSDLYDDERCKYNMKALGRSEVNEKLYGKQSKLDKNKNGKIDAEDFKMLRGGKHEKELDEKLYGNQHKIDKNKNGRIDAEDFKMLRKESKDDKFIQKATSKMDKKGTEGKFGSWCKRNGLASEDGEVTKECINKAMKSDNPSVVKMANFAKNIKGYKGSEHKKKSVKLSENEMIDFIEKIINEERAESKAQTRNMTKFGTAKGLDKYNQVHAKDGKENSDALKATSKKMKEYLKDGSKGEYDTNPKHFPKGNGELEKMSKKAYVMSDDGKEFLDDYMRPGMEDLVPDQVQYDENWVEDNIKGSSRTGNNPEWGNAEETKLGEKISNKQKAKKFHKAKEQAYRKSKQPVTDGTGENSGEGVNIKLESVDEKKVKKLNEEFDRMKQLIGYNKNTQ